MKLSFKKVSAFAVCMFLLCGVFKASAGQTVTTVTRYTMPSYLAPIKTDRIITGDINGDKQVNNKDLTRLLQYHSDWDVDVVEGALDINGDGNINNKDLTRLFQYLSDWEVIIYPSGVHNHKGDATYYQQATCALCGNGYYAQIYAYDLLDDNQKGIYNRLYEAVNSLDKSRIYLDDFATEATKGESDINVAFRALSYDKPDCFWMPRSYRVGKTVNTRTGKLTDIYADFSGENATYGEYHISAAQKEQMQTTLEQTVSNIIEGASVYTTDFDKEVYIHDYLCENIVYDDVAAASNSPDHLAFTAYGALIKGTCVCEGYSRAMQLLCQRLGIPCSLVTGRYASFDYEKEEITYTPHMWNIINPGNGCHYLDVTFDDLDASDYPTLCTHYCFNISTEEAEADHIFDAPYNPNSDHSDLNEEYNFFNTHGTPDSMFFYSVRDAYISETTLESVAAYINDLKNSGAVIADFVYDDEAYTPAEAMKLINRILKDNYGYSEGLKYGYGYYQNWMFILLVG